MSTANRENLQQQLNALQAVLKGDRSLLWERLKDITVVIQTILDRDYPPLTNEQFKALQTSLASVRESMTFSDIKDNVNHLKLPNCSGFVVDTLFFYFLFLNFSCLVLSASS